MDLIQNVPKNSKLELYFLPGISSKTDVDAVAD